MKRKHYDAEKLGLDSLEFVDLGLPSGTLWAKLNLGVDEKHPAGHEYNVKAISKILETREFSLPTRKQVQELYDCAQWQYGPEYDYHEELGHHPQNDNEWIDWRKIARVTRRTGIYSLGYFLCRVGNVREEDRHYHNLNPDFLKFPCANYHSQYALTGYDRLNLYEPYERRVKNVLVDDYGIPEVEELLIRVVKKGKRK